MLRNLLVSGLVASAFSAVKAQAPQNTELRRIVQGFRGTPAATTLASLAQIPASRLSVQDRAIAEMFRGFALYRLRRLPEAELAMQRAAAADPVTIPLPEVVGQDLVDVYRVNRARIPIVASFEVAPLEFVPQLDSATRLTYQMEGGRILRRGRALLRWLVVHRGTGDTAVVWRGVEGDSGIVWNGMNNGNLLAPGDYNYVLEARDQDSPLTTHHVRGVRLTHLSADSSWMLPAPVVPRPLPESSVFMVDDRERRSALLRRAFVIGGAGAILAGTAAAFVQTAIDRSAPRSGLRYAVASAYVAGITAIGVSAIVAWRSRTGRFRSEVAFPNNENIRLNRELQAEYEKELARVNRYNDLLRRATVVRQSYIGGDQR